jgi:c-di-GMP-binding flagellar brake protein YcgR
LVQISRFDEEGFRADLATGRTLDISPGGVRLELYHPLPLRSTLTLTLALNNQLIEVTGTVVHLEVLDADRCAMGVEFSDLSDEARRVIDAHVAAAGAA